MNKLLIGGPGTGKTTELVARIQKLRPNRFALLSFTRQAANEAKVKLGRIYNDKELEWVRTIHSLAFKILRLNRGSMFTDNHLKDFGNEHGFEFRDHYAYEEDGTMETLTEDEKTYRQMIIFETLGEDVGKADYLARPEIDFDAISAMWSLYTIYKKDKNLLDFNDILKLCALRQLPKFDLLAIDEAQDLSPLQFMLVNKLVENSQQVIFAGDDDQMIYEWAGVKRELFMNLHWNCETEILTENHRVPGSIMRKAENVVGRCRNRINKPSFGYDGNFSAIERASDLFAIDKFHFPNKSYLILTRNNIFLRDVRNMLDELGIQWTYLKRKDKTTNVQISTIHGAKGAEADIVILLTDVTGSTYQHITDDAEHRVWYVGMTRPKDYLIIVDPQSKYHYEV